MTAHLYTIRGTWHVNPDIELEETEAETFQAVRPVKVTRWVDPNERTVSAHINTVEIPGKRWIELEMQWLQDLHPTRRYRVQWNRRRTKMCVVQTTPWI